tara:strand:- start:1339 stop:1689 length:351 start_codon:yes stop_codon:yes gene_type:complete
MINVILDAILGGVMLGTISYLSNIYGKKSEYYKIIGFLWAVPLTYFFLLYIAMKDGKKAIQNLSRHALYGITLNILIILIILRIINEINITVLVSISFMYGLLTIMLYFLLKIYKY